MITIANDKIEAKIDSLGAQMRSLARAPRVGGKAGAQVLWPGEDERYWKNSAPILFPIVGALPGDAYVRGGVEYKMRNHGFARFKEFEVVRRTPESVDFRLVADDDTRAQYPFDFELGIGYALSGATLVHRFTVKNLGRTVMPVSFGGHPGFRCPAFEDERYEDYSLVFEKPETVLCRRKENGLKADARYPFLEGGACMALEKERFALSAILLDHLNSSSVRLVSAIHGPLVEVRFAGFTHLGLWSGAGDDPFVCIEPWYGIDSAADDRGLEEKEGILMLEPGATKEAAFEIECL